ncbi:FAD-binding oxidoreductase [Helcobacillus massiliensis]|uniref:FAD-binding oxidoreductase n=1 Tax=Helcobacillus massiliensis TaxID=521392 RepID=UPI0025547069|nr:FAD-binding oxidoreductase [Helcobacillus massiliensis]MDK7741811.1 FAD-binding oxidoreductase [Helcobacillus massiliensis]WOO92998.1 FAD-binding oxidoreductase [Helcobacillus massiliensis]
MISAADVKRHKWWGWGLDDVTFRFDNKPLFAPLVKEKVGLDLDAITPRPEPQLSDYEVPASVLSSEDAAALTAIVGSENVRTDDEYRVVHSFGRSVTDLFRARTGDFRRIVDAVVYPASDEEVQSILRLVVERDLVVIPFGGGSSISGSVTPDVDEKRAIITLNLGRMCRVLDIDDTAGLARVQAGVYGPDLEEQLQERGWTMGHFPDSFAYSTLGGWAATRSSGMQSDKYGDIEGIVRGLRLVQADGVIDTKPIPGRDSGSSVHEMVLGSEGRLGVITECTVRVHRVAPVREVIAYMFPDWESGVRGMHAIARSEVHPVFTRLSDGPETRFSLAMVKEPESRKSKAMAKVQEGLFAYLRSKGWDTREEMCISYVCFEGTKQHVEREKSAVKRIVKSVGGITLGAGPGKIYDQKKFDTPYLRDFLLGMNVYGDVSDTGTTWSRLNEMHSSVYDAFYRKLDEMGLRGFMFCHMSHSYHQGACLYFTFAVPYESDERMLEEYTALKHTIQQEFMHHLGTVSHHHAVGTEHQPWIAEDITDGGVRMLKDLYAAQDPGGNFNPGKIVTP